jgi:Flp pilus assembly protein TadG
MNKSMRFSRQRGQSTVEFVVVALVLTPLIISLLLLGKYLDLMNTTEQASRYVAFEGSTRNSSSSWKTDTELAAEVRRRFFSTSDAPVKTGDIAGDFSAHRNPLWTDHAGRPLLDNFTQNVGVQTQISSRSAIAAASPIANSLNLPSQNWYTGTVTVRPNNIPEFEPFDRLNLNVSRRTVLLADSWAARGPTQVRRSIEGSTVLYPARLVQPIIDAVGTLPTLVYDPALRLGEFDWDVVPCDRLVGGCP